MVENLGSLEFDNLFAGTQMTVVSEEIEVLEGQDLERGTLLGRVLKEIGNAEADGDNSGDADISDADILQGAQIGTYTIKCISEESNAGDGDAEFSVFAPDGTRLKDAEQEEKYDGGQIEFTIGGTGGATKVNEGDKFTVEVEEGSKKAKKIDGDAVDGANEPFGILTDDVDASDDDKKSAAYLAGEFNQDSVIVPESEDIEDYKDALRKIGIYLKPAVKA